MKNYICIQLDGFKEEEEDEEKAAKIVRERAKHSPNQLGILLVMIVDGNW